MVFKRQIVLKLATRRDPQVNWMSNLPPPPKCWNYAPLHNQLALNTLLMLQNTDKLVQLITKVKLMQNLMEMMIMT